ncbi:MAG: hypothetical protein QOF76_298 [Solirubrobacteraceae bacterium]|jgi:hypothetical protein|nr:hypothetical protein [Solirubrobacteraceae bacterium]
MAACEPADEGFFTSAPTRFVETFNIARPAQQVWEELTSDRPLDWCRLLSITWKSPRPFGVGTARQAKVAFGFLTVQERFFIWEEGRRKAFYVTSANLPMFKRFAEDYVIEPTGTDSCTFTWTLAAEPTALGKVGAPGNALIIKSLFADTRKHFAG